MNTSSSHELVIIKEFRLADNQKLPKHYHWLVHVISNSCIFFTSIVLSFYVFFKHTRYTPLTLATMFLISLLSWMIIEYGIHRYILHGSGRIFRTLVKEHSYSHHNYFTNEHMYVESPIDISRVFLMPSHIFSLVCANTIASIFLYYIFGYFAFLFLGVGVSYTLIYEITHSLSHFKTFSQSRWLKPITEHHKLHHNLRQMAHFNFAVAFPPLDLVFKTKRTIA